MVQLLCGRSSTIFLNNLLQKQHGCNTTAVKLAAKHANCSFNGVRHNKAATFSSMASLTTDNELIWDSSILFKKAKILKKNGNHATVQKGYASNSEDGHIWWSFITGVVSHLKLLYQFSRPHTIIGTIIGITSVSLLPLQKSGDICPSFFVGLVKALVPSVLMNVYVVGLNQLFDVDIDKINKPNLPLASGDLSMATGISIIAASLIMSLVMGVKFQSPPLLYALLVSFALGSVYSIECPLLRWKKHAFLAASCIVIVRAIVVQVAFFLHIQKFVLGKPVVFTGSLVFAIVFMCFFSAVIALFKDIPDVDGDKDFGIQSFSVNLGPERVFWLCVNLLLVAYGSAMVVGATSSVLVSKLVTVCGHCSLASILWLRAQKVDLSSKVSISQFYMFIWKLFYAEYFLIPFVR